MQEGREGGEVKAVLCGREHLAVYRIPAHLSINAELDGCTELLRVEAIGGGRLAER